MGLWRGWHLDPMVVIQVCMFIYQAVNFRFAYTLLHVCKYKLKETGLSWELDMGTTSNSLIHDKVPGLWASFGEVAVWAVERNTTSRGPMASRREMLGAREHCTAS